VFPVRYGVDLYTHTVYLCSVWFSNTQIHCVGRMQNFGVLMRVVHIVTTGLKVLKKLRIRVRHRIILQGNLMQ
jgi:hypothetical protein